MTQSVDYSTFYNPYDFSNPVTNRELFAGRDGEIAEICYYLEQTKKAPRPVNIALLGDRASGKTSILNMIELDAKDKGFCTVRIDLNEGDVISPLMFLFKIFDNLFSAACDFKKDKGDGTKEFCFGGKSGKTYDTYLDTISSYEIPIDKTFCPFIFPIQYAKAMSKNNLDCRVSEICFKDDLIKICTVVGVPIILLFDECNVLSQNRIILQILRNIFMNIYGYMLVFTGTQELFPIMDEVFSPIVRQFKKITITKFEDIKDTETCIKRPLERLGINSARVFDFYDRSQIREIHDITGGRPYEIQLICHYMFKRVQTGLIDRMKLSLEVLDEVLYELSRGKDIYSRTSIARIRDLDESQLNQLRVLTACNGYASFEQLWFTIYVLKSESIESKELLENSMKDFSEKGIIDLSNGNISFIGDDFDRIYCKYYAITRKVNLPLAGIHIENYFANSLKQYCNKLSKLSVFGGMTGYVDDTIEKLIGVLEDNRQSGAINEMCNALGAYSASLKLSLYKLLIDMIYKNIDKVIIYVICVKTPWMNRKFYYFSKDSGIEALKNLSLEIVEINRRANTCGGSIEFNTISINKASKEFLIDTLLAYNNQEFRDYLLNDCIFHLFNAYLKGELFEDGPADWSTEYIAFFVNFLYEFRDVLRLDFTNDLGYMLISIGEYEKSKCLLQRSIKERVEQEVGALSRYNLGIANLMTNELDQACSYIKEGIDILQTNGIKNCRCECLFIPVIVDKKVQLNEIYEPELYETAKEALKIISEILK